GRGGAPPRRGKQPEGGDGDRGGAEQPRPRPEEPNQVRWTVLTARTLSFHSVIRASKAVQLNSRARRPLSRRFISRESYNPRDKVLDAAPRIAIVCRDGRPKEHTMKTIGHPRGKGRFRLVALALAITFTIIVPYAWSGPPVRFVRLDGFAAPGTPADLNKVGVLQIGKKNARNILILNPGTSASAAYFAPLAKTVVKQSKGWAVWAVERRGERHHA